MQHQLLNSNTDGHRMWLSGIIQAVTNQYNNGFIHSNEEKYSGDKEINAYVNAFKQVNQNISRAELARFPLKYQVPIFSSLTNDNKARIFTEKVQLILRTENLSQAEANHIEKVLAFINPRLFSGGQEEIVSSFFDNWQQYAIQNFKWDTRRAGTYFKTILSKEDQKLFKYVHDSHPDNAPMFVGGNVGVPADCMCSPAPGQDFCSHADNLMCVTSKNCTQSSFGCGWLWVSACKGECQPILYVHNPPSTCSGSAVI